MLWNMVRTIDLYTYRNKWLMTLCVLHTIERLGAIGSGEEGEKERDRKRERERGTVMSMRLQPPYPMAPPFSARTMPLGFVPVEPISRHAGCRAVRGGRVTTGGDSYIGDARASFGGSCIISCGTGRQLAAATAVAAAAASSIVTTVAE